MEEVWKDVVGYGGLYQVSDQGRVRSLDTVKSVTSKNGKVYSVRKHGRVLSPALTKADGYLFVNLHKQDGGKAYLVHRLVASAFCNKPIGSDEVNHKDGQRLNNSHSNLEWVTRLENVRHCIDILKRQGRVTKSVTGAFADGTLRWFESQIAAEKELSGKQTGGISWAVKTGRRIYGAVWSRSAA